MYSARPSILEDYNRTVGALSSAIPAILYVLMALPALVEETSLLIWSFIQFVPLIIAGYYMDVVAKSKAFSKLRQREWILVIIVWIILFPIARISGIIASDLLVIGRLTYSASQLIPFILLSLILGAIYGFFFISAYLYLLKVVGWKRR